MRARPVIGLLVIWAMLLIALVVLAIRQPSIGGALTLAYFLGLSLIHVPGLLPLLDPAWSPPDGDETHVGFQMTTLAMAAFVAGSVLARWVDQRRAAMKRAPPYRRALLLERLGWRALVIGIVAYFVAVPLSRSVPSLTSIVSSVAPLLIIGSWLVLYGAVVANNPHRTLTTLALLPLLPLATLVTGGFLGFGMYWVLSILAFLFVITRKRIWFYLATPLVVFLGLSLFVTYMDQRTGIREVVWVEQSSLFDRLERVSAIATEFQLLDLALPEHVSAIDARLNQNWLVGSAVIYHEEGFVPFAYGATVPLWALIPRAIWPDKPEIGGGRDVVSEFTGIDFAKDVSVGAGQVLEFYINFGVSGLLIGFLVLGYLLMWLDQGIMRSLAHDDLRGLLLRGMPGLMLLQPGGNLLELLVGSVAAYVAAHTVTSLRLLDLPWSTRSRRQAA